jgi:magnesium transporter
VIVDIAVYREGRRLPGIDSWTDAWAAYEQGDGFLWVGLYEPSHAEFEEACTRLHLHELAVEDAIKAHQRPKLEVFGDTLFVVLRTARYVDETETVEFGEILVFVGQRFVVVVRHGTASELASARADLEARPDFLAHGPSAVLYGILDKVVDDYVPVLDGLEDDVSEVEEAVFSMLTANPVERIYKLKREVIDFRRSIAPLVQPLGRLTDESLPCVGESVRAYFRDVLDHVQRASEQVESLDDALTSVLEANLIQVGVRQNDDMRKISAWAAMAIVPTLIASIYGMNFQHIPFARHGEGFVLTVGFMVVIVVVMYRYFRRQGWL